MDLKAIPLTEEDINLITLALRRLSKETGFADIKASAIELIKYFEDQRQPS